MNDTIQDVAHQMFFDICERKSMSIDMFFLELQNFPKIDYEPRMTVYFPMPRIVQGMQAIQGSAFIDSETARHTIFAMFFASVCHAAGHAKITDFKKYKDWMGKMICIWKSLI